MTDWISVEDRLPELVGRADRIETGYVSYEWSGCVLAWDDELFVASYSKSVSIGGEITIYWSGIRPDWEKYCARDEEIQPTHWMPLPEPPEEK